jgi:hypothetical protein
MKTVGLAIICFITSLFQIGCGSTHNDFLPENERFTYPRSDRQLRGKVKSMVEVELTIDSSQNPMQKETQRNEVHFKSNGYLTRWTSYADGELDLTSLSDGVEYRETEMPSMKLIKEVRGRWEKEGEEHVLFLQTEVDGKPQKKTIKRYDAKYNLISVTEKEADGKEYWRRFMYTDGVLSGQRIDNPSVKYYYCNGRIDSVENLVPGQMTKYSYNMQGDIVQISRAGDGRGHQIVFTYTYDKQGNWITKEKRISTQPEFQYYKRNILYY